MAQWDSSQHRSVIMTEQEILASQIQQIVIVLQQASSILDDAFIALKDLPATIEALKVEIAELRAVNSAGPVLPELQINADQMAAISDFMKTQAQKFKDINPGFGDL